MSARTNDLRKRLTLLERRVQHLEERIDLLMVRVRTPRRRFYTYNDTWRTIVAESTTVHGLRDMLMAKRPLHKVLWMLVFWSAVAATGYYALKVAHEYMTDPTATKVKILRQPKFDYPMILICPDTWLDATKAASMNLSLDAVKYALAYLINYKISSPPYRFDSLEQHSSARKEFHRWFNQSGLPNVAELFKSLGLESKEFLIRCNYCRDTGVDFEKVLMNDGVCYKLKLPPIDARMSLTDLERLELNIPDRSSGLLWRHNYWKIFVNCDLSIAGADPRYVEALPSHSNTIRMMPKRFRSVRAGCVTDDEVRESDYSQDRCLAECMTESRQFSTSNRSCTRLMLLESDTLYDDVDSLCHTYPWPYEQQKDWVQMEPPLGCFDKCPSLCDRWIYDVTVSSHLIPMTNETWRSLPPNRTSDLHYDPGRLTRFYFLNELVLHGGVMFYDEVLTYSFETLISNLGGQMGLWLGASVMSLMQLGMLLTNCCVKARRQKRLRSSLKT